MIVPYLGFELPREAGKGTTWIFGKISVLIAVFLQEPVYRRFSRLGSKKIIFRPSFPVLF